MRAVGRPSYTSEYETRAESLLEAVRKHSYDVQFFTDPTDAIADDLAHSQHCQIFAVFSGAARLEERV